MHRRNRSQRQKAIRQGRIISRLTIFQSEIAVHNKCRRFSFPRGHFPDARREIFGHRHTTQLGGGISGDVCVRAQKKCIFVPRFAEPTSVTRRRNRQRNARKCGAFEKITTGKLSEGDRHKSKQDSRDGGVEQGGNEADVKGLQPEPRQICATFRRDRPDTAELDADGSKVRKSR